MGKSALLLVTSALLESEYLNGPLKDFMSNSIKPLILAVPLAIASLPWWLNLLLATLAYYLFGYLAEPPLLMIPSSGEAAATGYVSFFKGDVWSLICKFGMYGLPLLLAVAAAFDIGRIVGKDTH